MVPRSDGQLWGMLQMEYNNGVLQTTFVPLDEPWTSQFTALSLFDLSQCSWFHVPHFHHFTNPYDCLHPPPARNKSMSSSVLRQMLLSRLTPLSPDDRLYTHVYCRAVRSSGGRFSGR